MTLGERINNLRTSKNYSQEYLAEMLDISRQAVYKWEKDLSSPDTTHLIKLAEILGVSVEYLATGKENKAVMPQKNKFSKRFKAVSVISGVVFIVFFAVNIYISFLPVDFDAGACGGGFRSHIFNKYDDALLENYIRNHCERKYNLKDAEIIPDSYNVTWNTKDDPKKILFCFKVRYNHPEKGEVIDHVHFTGHRYWFEKYKFDDAVVIG